MDMGVKIHRIVKLKYHSGYFTEKHKHKYFHYVYILDGAGHIMLDDRLHHAAKGQLYLIPANVEHEIYSLKELATIHIKFTASPSFADRLGRLAYQVAELNKYEENIVMDILNEAVCAKEYYEEMINTRFADLLLRLLRRDGMGAMSGAPQTADEDHPHMDSKLFQQEFYNVMQYIHEHLDSCIRIKVLADMAGYSEAYFCTLFKRSFGKPPIQYINFLKIGKAKELLLYSDCSVTHISERLGFENIHYFSRLFKKITRMSPQEFLKKLNEDIVINIVNDSVYIPRNRFEFPQKRKTGTES